MSRHQCADVEVGEHVAVEGEEALTELLTELVGRKADRAGRSHRLGLDHIADAGPEVLALAERLAQDVG